MVNILLAEDEKELNMLISTCLKAHGYGVESAFDGEDAWHKFQDNKIDVVLSDIMMPKMDGFMLLEKIREADAKVPIIFISAKDDKLSKQFGYRLGIDDYIVKPFDIDELVLKLNALVRRLNITNSSRLVVGNLVMDKEEHTAYIDGEPVGLSVREFDILFKMLSFPKKTFTRSKLMDEFWDFDSSATSRTVDVYMAKLRDKTSRCEGFTIATVHGLGYKVMLNEE